MEDPGMQPPDPLEEAEGEASLIIFQLAPSPAPEEFQRARTRITELLAEWPGTQAEMLAQLERAAKRRGARLGS